MSNEEEVQRLRALVYSPDADDEARRRYAAALEQQRTDPAQRTASARAPLAPVGASTGSRRRWWIPVVAAAVAVAAFGVGYAASSAGRHPAPHPSTSHDVVSLLTPDELDAPPVDGTVIQRLSSDDPREAYTTSSGAGITTSASVDPKSRSIELTVVCEGSGQLHISLGPATSYVVQCDSNSSNTLQATDAAINDGRPFRVAVSSRTEVTWSLTVSVEPLG